MRTIIGVAAVIAVGLAAGCTGTSATAPPPGRSASATPSPSALPPRTTSLDCSLGSVETLTAPLRSTLDAVGLDTGSTLGVSRAAGTDPHPLFAKTGLYVHVGHAATLTVPADWAARVSIFWGNRPADWTTSLHIPACPEPSPGAGQWLAFPGGFSVEKAACIPMEVRAGSEMSTVHVSVGVACPG
jgi:hypothetical protein